MPPNFNQQAHQRAVQTQHRHHQQAVQTHLRMSRSHAQPMRPGTHWNSGGVVRGSFSLVGFLISLVFLAVFLAVAIAVGPKLIDEVNQRMDSQLENTGGTEQPAP